MNDFDAWQEILNEWKKINRMKKINQRLYDYLGSSIIYILEYTKKNGITLPHRDVLYRMVERAEEDIDILKWVLLTYRLMFNPVNSAHLDMRISILSSEEAC